MNHEEAMRWIARERFIDNHHHLISPWAYTPAEIGRRNANMLAVRWMATNG